MHGAGGATPEAEAKERATLIPGGPNGGPPPPPLGHQRARKHGGYSAKLEPDEVEVYEAVKSEFEEFLGDIDPADRRIIHQLEVVAAKFDGAAQKGAHGDVLSGLNRTVLELLRELKATRASREPQTLVVTTPAQLAAQMMTQIVARKPGLLPLPETPEDEVIVDESE